MMVFFAVAREGRSPCSSCSRLFSRTWASGRRWARCSGWPRRLCLASCSTGAAFVLTGAFFKWTSLFILLVAAGLAAGAIRAFHEAGLWNHFRDVAFDLSNVLSTHSLTGTLLEGIFGYRETPSVSEVAMYFIYLVPALILFAMPPRTGSQTSRVAP